MMKKISTCIRIMLFIAAITVPLFGFIFVDKNADTSLSENRIMAEFPEISKANYKNISTGLDAYINDHLPFRDSIITAYSRVLYYAFKTSFNEDVVIGKDGWLFFDREIDGDPVGCYQGTNLLTEEELKTIAENLQISSDNAAKEGREFVIMIAPNKERVYAEYMPDYYGKPAPNYSAKILYDYLKANTTVNIVYPFDELMSYKGSSDPTKERLYYKVDTHWRHYAAYIATYSVLKALDYSMVSPDDITLYDDSLNEEEDLARFLHLEKPLAEHIYKVSKESYAPDSPIDKRLYVVGDSFYKNMAEILQCQFIECEKDNIVYEPGVQAATIRDYDADIIALVFVERHISFLLNWRYE